MTVDDDVAGVARRAAARLADSTGPGVVGDVEAALAGVRPGQYLDPVSLGGLIVSVATLAWQVYTDLKARAGKPSPQVLARQVRVELLEGEHIPGPDDARVIEVVVEETFHQDHEAD